VEGITRFADHLTAELRPSMLASNSRTPADIFGLDPMVLQPDSEAEGDTIAPTEPSDDVNPAVSNTDLTEDASRDAADRGLRILGILLIVALVILSGQWLWMTTQRPEPLPWQHGDEFPQLFRVDVNEAKWIEWMQLKGIGQIMAHRIVADRETNGPFRSVEDLLRVHGIGPATLDEIRPWLTFDHGPQQ